MFSLKFEGGAKKCSFQGLDVHSQGRGHTSRGQDVKIWRRDESLASRTTSPCGSHCNGPTVSSAMIWSEHISNTQLSHANDANLRHSTPEPGTSLCPLSQVPAYAAKREFVSCVVFLLIPHLSLIPTHGRIRLSTDFLLAAAYSNLSCIFHHFRRIVKKRYKICGFCHFNPPSCDVFVCALPHDIWSQNIPSVTQRQKPHDPAFTTFDAICI